ncbi:methyltransferase domain-containing protein [candidate division KSB1 bacterium]
MFAKLLNRLQATRKNILLDLLAAKKTAWFSAATYSLSQALTIAVEQNVRGRVLDCGAGLHQHRDLLAKNADSYESIDWKATEGLTYVGDVQSMDMIIDSRYDTVFCSQVLEHLSRPWDALAEIFRVLKPGGRLLISAPHLSRLHEHPHDYFRYTAFGLKSLLENSGFQTIAIRHVGGLITFLTHQISTILLSSTWKIPLIRSVVFEFNQIILIRFALWLDQKLPRNELFAVNYLAVAQRPAGGKPLIDQNWRTDGTN